MRLFRLFVVMCLVAVAATACGDDDAAPPDNGDQVVIGSGEIPDSVPSDLPIPAGSLIGSTVVDKINTRTEVEIRTPAHFDDVVQFWSVNLVSSGYVVSESSGSETRWSIDFIKGAIEGTVTISAADVQVTRSVVELNLA